jgi:presenilin-like A22 family membrane protease
MTKDSKKSTEYLAVIVMGLFFIIINGLALLIIQPFESAGIQPAFEDPSDPFNLIYILGIMLVFTLVILLIAKYWKKQVIQFIILFAIGYIAFYAFFLPAFNLLIPFSNFYVTLIASIIGAFILVLLLYKYPEWYVIDICGIIIGTSAIIIFGMSLSIFLVVMLLIVLAIYDAISVYKTKHMIDLADTVMDLKLPVLLVVPKIRNYSLLKETKRLKEKLKDGEEREAFFMGLGDVVMPGILVIAIFYGVSDGLPVALGTLAGTLIGYLILMRFVLKGNPQAGLPLLCGGAILGYIISSFIFFGSLMGFEIMI